MGTNRNRRMRVCGVFFAVFLGAADSLHSGGDEFLKCRHFPEVKNRDLSNGELAESGISGCEHTFQFLKKSEKRVLELGEVAVEPLHLFRDRPCAKRENASTKPLVRRGPVQRGGCYTHERRKGPLCDSSLRTPKCLIALIARSKVK